MVLIINQNLMKAKITTTHMKIIASVFTMCTNLARHSSQLLWQQYICFLQYPSLIIYTQGKKKSWRNDTTGAISAHLLPVSGTSSEHSLSTAICSQTPT